MRREKRGDEDGDGCDDDGQQHRSVWRAKNEAPQGRRPTTIDFLPCVRACV
jgi:hypothetical protein